MPSGTLKDSSQLQFVTNITGSQKICHVYLQPLITSGLREIPDITFLLGTFVTLVGANISENLLV
jgi:hypothetical protein